MKQSEMDLLKEIDKKLVFCLQKNVDKNYLSKCLDKVIINLPDDTSLELFLILYRLQYKLLTINNK